MVRIDIDVRVDRIQQPENLLFSRIVAKQHEICRAAGCYEPFFSYGDTESPFIIPDDIRIHANYEQSMGELSSPGGLPELRQAVSDFYSRHYNIRVEAERIIIGHGVKDLIFPLFTLLGGSVIVPTPGWLGYLPQLRILNKPYYRLYGHRAANYKISPMQLTGLLKGLVQSEHLLIVHNPGYPSGIVYTRNELEKIAEICRTYNTLVLANETYSLLAYDQSQFVSMGSIYPEGTFILNGLSREKGADGFRIGTCIMPEGSSQKIREEYTKTISTVYSAPTISSQLAAVAIFEPNPDTDSFIQDTREIHRIMTTRLASVCAKIEGIRTTIPEGGFSFMADLNSMASELQNAGIQYSNDLAQALIQHPYHIATVGGEAIMAAYSDFFIRFSVTDYDGKMALSDYRNFRPESDADEEIFFLKHGSRMITGIEMLRTWVKDLKDGKITARRTDPYLCSSGQNDGCS